MAHAPLVGILLATALLAGCSSGTTSADCGPLYPGPCADSTETDAGSSPPPWGTSPPLSTPRAGGCPGHWHATFAVFVPSTRPSSDGKDAPVRIDWATPTSATGRPYYNFGTAPGMTLAVHMHQDGPEQGAAALGPAQLHFEGNKCVGLADAFAAIDLAVTETTLTLTADSPVADHNPGGPWAQSGAARLRFFLEAQLDNGTWEWQEHDLGDALGAQLQDGEAMLLAFGDYTNVSIATMQDTVPAPTTRST